MEMDITTVELLGPMVASRPLSKRSRPESPVEVVFSSIRERDLVISSVGPLFRKGTAKEVGRLFSVYPEPWLPLKNHLERHVDLFRNHKHNGQQVFHAQLRYSDNADGICVFVKNVIEKGPWLRLKKAQERYVDKPHYFPPSLQPGQLTA